MDSLLVVDDDPTSRDLIAALLEDEGYTLVFAVDGIAAQEELQRQREALSAVVLDWGLPGMSGIDLLHWMKGFRDFDNTPVIMLTGRDSPEYVREGIDAGAFYYLTKPLRGRILQSIVRAALSDRAYKTSLLKLLAACQNPLGCLVEGDFLFRTLEEAEQLAVIIANASPQPTNVMGINEIFLNAVEHGNLGITYDDKTVLLEKGMWRQEVDRRLTLPENLAKKVEVHVERRGDTMHVTIKDAGTGFDFKKYLTFDPTRVFHTHGRGIAMVGHDMRLEYLGNGNCVTITIPAPRKIA
jgi:DNA-binding response OmpR family regulator